MNRTIPKTSIKGLILQVLTWRKGASHSASEVFQMTDNLMAKAGKRTSFREVMGSLVELRRSRLVVFSFEDDHLNGRWAVTKTGQDAAAEWLKPETPVSEVLDRRAAHAVR